MEVECDQIEGAAGHVHQACLVTVNNTGGRYRLQHVIDHPPRESTWALNPKP